MSGAAGALVPLAPANRLTRIMSALTLLSAIAPAVPSVPQGSSDEAASGFQSLLAALAGEEVATQGAKTGPDETDTPGDTKADAPAVTGFLVAPAPLVLPAAEGSSDGHAKASKDGSGEADPATFPPVPAVASEASDGAHTTPLPTADKNPTPKTAGPQVQPAVADLRLVREPLGDNRSTLAETAAAAEAVETQARTSAPPSPSTPPAAAPPPAPLRALAERASRPLEAPTGKTGDSPRAADSVPTVPSAAAAAAPAPTAQPTGPADFVAAAAAREAAEGGQADSPASDQPPLGEGTSAQAQAPTAAREAVGSQLSRATIEATAQIAAQILRRLEGRSTRFEMALTPDELGRVDVKLDIDSEGRLNARLAFDNPAAATDLRGRADELRRQLEDAGFHLAEDAFEFADRDSGSSAFDRGQDARNGSSRAFAAASRLNSEIDVAQPPRWLALTLSPSGVDMKV